MNIVVLTGAGISAESGLATFRDLGGIWAQVRLEEVATPEAFAADPERVHGFYNARRAQVEDPCIRPNAAHEALARLDREWRQGFLLVTQNVDGLHAAAGSRRMVEMHGALRRVRCLRCAAIHDWRGPCGTATPCPACGQAGGLRPAVVWFGEMPEHMDAIEAALADCDLFVSIGTSGQVYPAAGFVAGLRGRARTLELNLEPSAGSRLFDAARHGPATRLVPAWVDEVLATP
ncbi:MAG: NAD-dependent deacylase [Acetobacteraceae bacterium]|nr:NAD-dependent deacylase [Acetobacteraceae bacterium]